MERETKEPVKLESHTSKETREPYSISQWEFKKDTNLPMVRSPRELMVYENSYMVYPTQQIRGPLVPPKDKTLKEVVTGVLNTSDILCLKGPMNAAKSMSLLALAVSIGTGKQWLGHPCQKGKVLYINAGMSKVSLWRKLDDVARAMHVKGPLENISIWHIMPRPVDDWIRIHELIHMIKPNQFDAIIIDPIHHFRLPTKDCVRRCGDHLIKLAKHYQVAVIFARHDEPFFACDHLLELDADVVMHLSKQMPPELSRFDILDDELWSLDYEFFTEDGENCGVYDDPPRRYVMFDYPLYDVL